MNQIINNAVIDCKYLMESKIQSIDTKGILTQSSIDINEVTNNFINEENLQDTLLDNGREADFENYENEDVLLERVWWLCKPRIVSRQLPTVSARQIQAMRQRLSSTIKKPSSLVETLRGKVEGHLKQQRRQIKEFQHNTNK